MSQRVHPTLVIGRLRDYFGRRTNWQRRLWNPGTITVLEEVLEAACLLNQGHFSNRAVQALAATAEIRAGRDSGIGPSAIRKVANRCLREITKSQTARYKLEYLLRDVSSGYFERWAAALRSEPDKIATEQASRVIAGHLFALGFSPDKLHKWGTWLEKGRQPETLADLFEEAEMFSRLQERVWSVFVPFRRLARHEQAMPSEWLNPKAARLWLAQHVGGFEERHQGGFVLTIRVRDPWAAVDQAGDILESLGNRATVGVPGNPRFEPLTVAFVAGSDQPFSLERPRRRVEIHSLKRANALFALADSALPARLQSAIDLIAPLERGPHGAAIAGGWAVLEAIFGHPEKKNIEVARDMSLLIACSLPRAELTSLSYAYLEQHDDALSSNLRDARSNRDRCLILCEAIGRTDPLAFPRSSDQAAYDRLRAMIADPGTVLNKVVEYVEESLSRLYRQRNLVLHAGETDSVAMPAVLRTVPPLLGAGLDRLVHDALTNDRSDPLRLVARAEVELRLCGQPGGSHIVDLLGH